MLWASFQGFLYGAFFLQPFFTCESVASCNLLLLEVDLGLVFAGFQKMHGCCHLMIYGYG